MRRPSLLSLLVVSACAALEEGGVLEPPVRSLFDGSTLGGWEGDPRFWRVEGGAIVGESTAADPCEETTYLVWRGGEAADFVLRLEWRLLGGNSGLQFRSRANGPTAVAGYQADLEDGPDWTGGLYEQDGRGIVTRRGERVVLDRSGGKTVERFADGAELLARVDPHAWNRMRVTAFGPRLTIEVNGELFSETIDLDPARAARRGTLALQLHAGPPMRVEFRDLRLRALGEPPGESATAAELRPEWLWPPVPVADRQVAWFRRTFELDGPPEKAELWISGDNHFDAWLGGQGVATSDDWGRPVRVDVTRWLREGENELLVRCENDEREAGLILTLAVELEGGARFALASDRSFEACLQGSAGLAGDALARWLDDGAVWQPVQSFGRLGVGPWGTLGEEVIGAGEAPEAASIRVPPGFTVERLLSVDLATQGSWVSLAADPRGRLYAGDQYGGIFRVTVPPVGASGETRVERVPIELGEAHGLLWAHDSLYVVVNAAGEHASGLYRARDTDGDDVLDRVDRLRYFDGDGEHGPHAVVLDADGSLLVVAGNYTKLPEPIDLWRRPRNWAEDVLLPPIGDPNGHAVEIRAPGGWVARTDPGGRRWELVAAGFRNSYDLAVSSAGEVFTFDSDMEWDVGMPWYKPTRILHVVSGAEFGWRTGSGNWPADAFDALPSVTDVGLGSPTGLAFGTGTRFPEPWRSALFACDWAYGRILAVHLVPEGASYRGSHEVFASGQPFPVTDLAVGRDGALYVTIGGRQTQSGLYRISWQGGQGLEPGPHGPPGPPRSSVALGPPGSSPALLRRTLERSHGAPAADLALPLSSLGHPDPFVRHAARTALECSDPSLWARDVNSGSARRQLEGLLAKVHADPGIDPLDAVESALGILTASGDRSERLDALRLLELVLLRLDAGDAERERIRLALDPAYPSGDARLDRVLLDLLVAVEADVAGRALDELERASTQEERVAILYALRALDAHWNEALGRRLLMAFERELASVQGGLSARGFLEVMRDQAAEHVGLVLDPGTASVAASAHVPAARPARHAWTLAELEPILGEVGGGRDLARGRAAYEIASCARCHRFAGEGANLGPDLTGAAGRYSARDLLVAILEPSREVPDVWRDTELWGGGELLAVGRVEAEEEGALVVRDTSGARVSLMIEMVEERRVHPLSRMPEGLLDVLELEEVLDLCAYVLGGGGTR